ncbi:MAG: carboxypeptidase regulatory-like domain-containing protein [Syntrophobacteraceae bacterium]
MVSIPYRIFGASGRGDKRQPYKISIMIAIVGAAVIIAGWTLPTLARKISSTANQITSLPDFFVETIATDGLTTYIGGNFTTIQGQSRCNIAAIDASTGEVTPWNPIVGSICSLPVVHAIAISADGGVVYVGTEYGVFAFDAATGEATSWNPNAHGAIYALAVSGDGSTVYAAGDFTYIGGQYRTYLAALDASTGKATSWYPVIIGSGSSIYIYAIALSGDGGTVYVGGLFSDVAGLQYRNNIAAFDASTGEVTSWNPNADNSVFALGVSGDTIYAGGAFFNIGGQSRNGIAAIDASTGLATSWNTNAGGSTNALAVSGNTIYTGGTEGVVAIDASTGLTTSWYHNFDNSVFALTVSNNGTLYAGGGFLTVDGTPSPYFIQFKAYSISGIVKDGNGSPLAGVNIALSGASSATTQTASDGSYSFHGLLSGVYAITPTMAQYTFSPQTINSTITNNDLVSQNFTQTYSISGAVTGNKGSPLEGVTVALSGTSSATTRSASNGTYSFSGLSNGSYAITPSIPGYTFKPQQVTITDQDIPNVNFSGTIVYSISGTVTLSGHALAGVTITLSGTAEAVVATGASGTYSLTGLTAGSYTLTPSMTDYTFTPPNVKVTLNKNLTGRNFAATPLPRYSISGKITVSGHPLEAVTVTLRGAANGGTVTKSSGTYSFSGLLRGPYTVTPSMTGYTFNPPNRNVPINNKNATGENFTGKKN